MEKMMVMTTVTKMEIIVAIIMVIRMEKIVI